MEFLVQTKIAAELYEWHFRLRENLLIYVHPMQTKNNGEACDGTEHNIILD